MLSAGRIARDLSDEPPQGLAPAMEPGSMLLVVPVPFCVSPEGTLLVEQQAWNGLERWAENFDRMIVAAPVIPESMGVGRGFRWVSAESLPSRARIELVRLPWAYRPDHFVKAWRPTRRVLAGLIPRAEYLQFAIGGLFGDWGSVASLEAARQGRRFAVHADRVEDEVVRRTVGNLGVLQGLRKRVEAAAMRLYHRHIIRRCTLGLWHGKECYDAYAPFCAHSYVIHDVHTKPEDVLDAAEAERKSATAVSAPELSICYAGRADAMKGPLDWIRALARARDRGVRFRATWIGEGPMLEEMRDLAQQLGLSERVSFPGFVAERSRVLAVLRSSHLLLFTHLTPESPRCLLEALISATPIVGYGSAFPEELVERSGGGLFVPIGDADALGDSISSLWQARERLGALIQAAAISGRRFSDTAVFRARSELIKQHLTLARSHPVQAAPPLD